jgi:DNA-binding NtrC family response regulator
MGGKETIDQLLAIDPEVKAIVSSGYSTDQILAHHEKFGFKDKIAKPYTIEEVRAVLARFLSK